MRDPVRSCVGHDDRVERDSIAPVGCNHRSFRMTEVIEPKELMEIVSCGLQHLVLAGQQ